MHAGCENACATEGVFVAETLGKNEGQPGERSTSKPKSVDLSSCGGLTPSFGQGTQSFGGIRVGNGPTEDQAEIIQHDQLSQHSEEEAEVRGTFSFSSNPGRLTPLNNSVDLATVGNRNLKADISSAR